MTSVLPVVYTAPPVVEPYKFGLFGATQELTDVDPHWEFAGVEWESLATYEAMEYRTGAAIIGGQGGTKVLPNNIGTTRAFPFVVYAGVDCSGIGRPQPEYQERALEILALAEQHAAENALWTGGPGNTPNLNAAGTTTLSATSSVRAAVGELEKWLSDHYNGRGVLHASRDVAAVADFERQVRYMSSEATEDTPGVEHLETTLGTRWVFGGGYDGTGPNAVAPSAGTAWIYATGQLTIARGDVVTPADFDHALNRSTNRQFLIAERSYLVGVDGPIAAVQVTLD